MLAVAAAAVVMAMTVVVIVAMLVVMFVAVAMAAATVFVIVMHADSSSGLFAVIIPIGHLDVKTFISGAYPSPGLAVAVKIRYNICYC